MRAEGSTDGSDGSATTPELRLVELWNRTDRIFETCSPRTRGWRGRSRCGIRSSSTWGTCRRSPGTTWATPPRRSRRPRRDADFDELFSRGIDPDVDDPSRCHAHPDVPERWPSIADVLAYRDRSGRGLAARGGGRRALAPDALSMVVEHELMHQETLMYMAQRLSAGDRAAGLAARLVLGSRGRAGAPRCGSRRDLPRSARARARSTSAGTTSSPPPRCGCPASRSTRPR